MAVFNANRKEGEENCFLFHCQGEQDCPLSKAPDGLSTYDVYKGRPSLGSAHSHYLMWLSSFLCLRPSGLVRTGTRTGPPPRRAQTGAADLGLKPARLKSQFLTCL